MSPHGHMTPDRGSEWRRAWFRRTVRRLGLALARVTRGRRFLPFAADQQAGGARGGAPEPGNEAVRQTSKRRP